jgi:hypothetical protein
LVRTKISFSALLWSFVQSQWRSSRVWQGLCDVVGRSTLLHHVMPHWGNCRAAGMPAKQYRMAVLFAPDIGEAELDEATAAALQLTGSSREAGVGGVTWASRPDGGLDLVRLSGGLCIPKAPNFHVSIVRRAAPSAS